MVQDEGPILKIVDFFANGQPTGPEKKSFFVLMEYHIFVAHFCRIKREGP